MQIESRCLCCGQQTDGQILAITVLVLPTILVGRKNQTERGNDKWSKSAEFIELSL